MTTELPTIGDAEPTWLASEPIVVGVTFSGWLVAGFGVAVVASWLGYDRRTWLGLGAALGPLSLALLLLYRSQRHRAPIRIVDQGEPGAGSLSILVALLGAPEDAAEAAPLLRANADQLGQVTLCRTVRAEALLDRSWSSEEDDAADALAAAAVFLGDIRPASVLLPEPAAETIPAHAVRIRAHHVIVLGDRRVQRAVVEHPRLRSRVMTVASPGEPPT